MACIRFVTWMALRHSQHPLCPCSSCRTLVLSLLLSDLHASYLFLICLKRGFSVLPIVLKEQLWFHRFFSVVLLGFFCFLRQSRPTVFCCCLGFVLLCFVWGFFFLSFFIGNCSRLALASDPPISASHVFLFYIALITVFIPFSLFCI